MSKRRLFMSLSTAAALTVGACGTGTQDAAAPTLNVQELPTDSSVGGSISSDAVTGTSQSSTPPAPTTQAAPERSGGDKPAIQPAGEQSRLGSSVLAGTLDPAAQTSARFEAHIEMISDDYPEPLVITMSGAFDLPNESSEFEFDMSAVGSMMADADDSDEAILDFSVMFAEPMRMITIGDEAWMQWGFLAFLGLEEGQWLAVEPEGEDMFGAADFGFGSLGSPDELLNSMKELDATIEELGTETIHGVETRHLRATVDPTSLGADEQADFEDDFGQLPTQPLPIDFWVGEDGLLYRFSMSFDATEVEDDPEFESFSMTFDMFDYGIDLGISAPDPSTVVDEASLGLS